MEIEDAIGDLIASENPDREDLGMAASWRWIYGMIQWDTTLTSYASASTQNGLTRFGPKLWDDWGWSGDFQAMVRAVTAHEEVHHGDGSDDEACAIEPVCGVSPGPCRHQD